MPHTGDAHDEGAAEALQVAAAGLKASH